MGVAPGDATPIVNAILDWTDPDDQTCPEGAETAYYQGRPPPDTAKNWPIDDLSELLLIQGMTPEMYWGARDHPPGDLLQAGAQPFGVSAATCRRSQAALADLFTPLSDGKININTASAEVLQLIPGVDAMVAEAIVSGRQGTPDPWHLV